jgi:hypothetical protein
MRVGSRFNAEIKIIAAIYHIFSSKWHLKNLQRHISWYALVSKVKILKKLIKVKHEINNWKSAKCIFKMFVMDA